MTTYKSLKTLTRAAERLIDEMGTIAANRDVYGSMGDKFWSDLAARVDNVTGQLSALWSNPADAKEANRLVREIVALHATL